MRFGKRQNDNRVPSFCNKKPFTVDTIQFEEEPDEMALQNNN